MCSIPCDFKFVEYDPDYPKKALDRMMLDRLDCTTTKSPPVDKFECEESDDDFEDEKEP